MKRFINIAMLLSALTLNAQEDRPKVGLVLSGGSAHGIAHIGVLKVLEEQGVQVDYITGTSMGSIIGGLYAMGMSAEEIEQLTYDQDWSELLATNVPLNEIAPSEKSYHNRYGLTLQIRDGGVKLPEGFLNSQKLDLELNRMFSPAHDIHNFNDLAYPFKCVAVNIVNGDVEVLDEGYLGTAVRSSMAIPSIFAPVEMGDKLLVDGGLIRNFPVEEVIEMGADIIIGVYVGSKLEEKRKLNNLLEILNQSAFMMGILDSEDQKKKVDILIEPQVKHLPNFGFDKTDVLIREGYISATEHMGVLKEIASAQSSYQLQKPEALSKVSSLHLADTRFPFIRSPYDALANFKYGNYKKGNMSLDQIEAGISRIFGTKHFDNINYTFRNNSRGEKILGILAEPRKVNSIAATFNYLPSSSTSLILTNELRNVLDEPSVLYSTVRLAENYGLKLDYQYRLGNKKDFILNTVGQVHRFDQNLYDVEVLRERYTETQAFVKVGVGYEPNNNVLVTTALGIEGSFLKPIGIDQEGFANYKRLDGQFFAGISYDDVDDVQFPNKGINVALGSALNAPLTTTLNAGSDSPIYVPEDELYIDAYIKGVGYYPLSDIVTGEIRMSAGYKSKPSLSNNFRIGGLENRNYKSIGMLGLNTHQLHMSRYYKAGMAVRFQLLRSVFFTLQGDYLKGRKTFLLRPATERMDVSLWGFGAVLGVRSPLGPMQISYGHNTLTESWNTSFKFGYSFF